MDRLSAVGRDALTALAVTVVAIGCGGGAPPPATSRVEAVSSTGERPDPAKWCDVWFVADAPRLTLPPVAAARPGQPVPPLPAHRWVWLNVWATWCMPCRHEMPLLERWVAKLGREGVPLDLWFLSVDEDANGLARFLSDNPSVATGPSVRLLQADALGRWLAGMHGAADSAIPIQVIAAPGGEVRCVRAGSLRDSDFPTVRALLAR